MQTTNLDNIHALTDAWQTRGDNKEILLKSLHQKCRNITKTAFYLTPLTGEVTSHIKMNINHENTHQLYLKFKFAL